MRTVVILDFINPATIKFHVPSRQFIWVGDRNKVAIIQYDFWELIQSNADTVYEYYDDSIRFEGEIDPQNLVTKDSLKPLMFDLRTSEHYCTIEKSTNPKELA